MKKIVFGLLVVLGCLAGPSYGTTIGFSGIGANNSDLSSSYGSNATADGAGWTTTDGTGTSPDIRFDWAGGANIWEVHNSSAWTTLEDQTAGGTWDNGGSGVNIVQLDDAAGATDGHLEVHLYNDSATDRLRFNSIDIGLASDMAEDPYTWTVKITTLTDPSTELWSYTTALMSASSVETVDFGGFAGGVGEDYTLHFDRSVGEDNIFTYRTAIDNLSFSQIPEPATLGMVGFSCIAILFIRRKLSM